MRWYVLLGLVGLSACNTAQNEGAGGSAGEVDGDAFAGIPTLHYACYGQASGELSMTPARGAPARARVVLGDTQWTLAGQPTETGAKYSNGQISLLTSPGEATLVQNGVTTRCKQVL